MQLSPTDVLKTAAIAAAHGKNLALEVSQGPIAAVTFEATGVTDWDGCDPQVSAIGSGGEYVVIWYGADSGGDSRIFVQKFNADGTATGSAVQLETTCVANGGDYYPQVFALGSGGEYAVTWYRTESGGDYSIFVQKFNADGTMVGSAVQLEAIGVTGGWDESPQVAALGSGGEYVVTWYGPDSGGDFSIFIQKFNTDGTVAGNAVQFEAPGAIDDWDFYPQVAALGSGGEYVVTWRGADSGGDCSIFVQKFNADGTISNDVHLSTDTGASSSDYLTNTASEAIAGTVYLEGILAYGVSIAAIATIGYCGFCRSGLDGTAGQFTIGPAIKID